MVRRKTLVVYGDISTNKYFTFQAKLGFEPSRVELVDVLYYNNGSDTGTYYLTSDLFNHDSNVGTAFREAPYRNKRTIHCLQGPVNGNTYTFWVNESSGGTNAAGKITLVLTFIEC